MRFKKKENRNYALILVIFIILLLATVIFYLLNLNIFTVKKIDIKFERVSCIQNSDLKNDIKISSQNIFFVNPENFQSLKRKYPCIKEIFLSKIYPDKIEIKLKGRTPFAKILEFKNEASDSSQIISASDSANILDEGFIIDDEGIVFEKNPSLSLIKILIPKDSLKIGDKLSFFKFEYLVEIINTLKKIGITIKEFIFSEDKALYVDGDIKIYFDISKEPNFQLASLQLILEKAKIEDSLIEFIDLRFDKPIVKFAPKK